MSLSMAEKLVRERDEPAEGRKEKRASPPPPLPLFRFFLCVLLRALDGWLGIPGHRSLSGALFWMERSKSIDCHRAKDCREAQGAKR